MISEKELREYFRLHDLIYEDDGVLGLASALHALYEPGGRPLRYILDVEADATDSTKFFVRAETDYIGDIDAYTYHVPYTWLDGDWVDELKAELARKERLQQEARQREADIADKKKEAAEYARYLELHQKFGGG